MGEKKRTLRGFLCAALGGVCWGASGTVGQYLFTCQGVDSGWLTVVRMFLAGAVLLGGALVRHRPQLRTIWSDRRDTLRLVLFSVGGLMTCQYTYLAAIRYSNSATATVLQYMGQALILLWVCLRARRLPTRREGVALVLALLGAFLLATHGSLTALALSPQALFWGLCAAVSLMLYTLLPGDLLRRYPVSVCTGCGMFIGGVVLALGKLLFCGDTLFAGSCGRTDMPGGSGIQMQQSLSMLAESDLRNDMQVLPGHGEDSTLGRERLSNPFMTDGMNSMF